MMAVMKSKKSKTLIIVLQCIFIWVCLFTEALAATYYVDTKVSTDLGSGSVTNPKKFIKSGISLLSNSGGDTLVIRNGTYSTTNDQIKNVPNGQAGSYNIIKSENDGGVVITASSGLTLAHTNQYIQIEGLKFVDSSQRWILGNHIKILRCGFSGAPATDNYVTVGCGTRDFNDTAYILFEDCWSYGAGGRYNFIAYNSNYVIFRRCVARHDGGWTDIKGDPEAGICIYNSSHVELQNCIVLDSNLSTYHTWRAGYYIICNTASPNGTIDVRVRGNIALNLRGTNDYQGVANDGSGFANDGNCQVTMPFFTDNVTFDTQYGNGNASSQCNISSTLTRCTIGNTYNGVANWNSNTYGVIDSVFFNLTGYDFNSGASASYVDRYNIANYNSCANGVSYNPQTNGLLYLPRIEDGSALKTAGHGGGQIGAQIVKRIGVSGTLFGETGYADLTSKNLWPFPNENKIRNDFREVSKRGFCADVKQLNGIDDITLTSYIWEYLKKPIPSDIYTCPKPGVTKNLLVK